MRPTEIWAILMIRSRTLKFLKCALCLLNAQNWESQITNMYIGLIKFHTPLGSQLVQTSEIAIHASLFSRHLIVLSLTCCSYAWLSVFTCLDILLRVFKLLQSVPHEYLSPLSFFTKQEQATMILCDHQYNTFMNILWIFYDYFMIILELFYQIFIDIWWIYLIYLMNVW